MFQAEYSRLHGWPKEDPLEVAADLGSRGGGLAAIEKARKVMGERLGPVRTWTDLPVRLTFSSSWLRAWTLMADGNPATGLAAVPFGVRLPSQQGASERGQSAQDAALRACSRIGELRSDDEGRVSVCGIGLDPALTDQPETGKVPVLPYGDEHAGGAALVLLRPVGQGANARSPARR